MTHLPHPPSFPPSTWIDIRRECLSAAAATPEVASAISVIVTAKAYEGYVLYGDLELAYRYAGCTELADIIAKAKAEGKAHAVPESGLPANVAALRPKG